MPPEVTGLRIVTRSLYFCIALRPIGYKIIVFTEILRVPAFLAFPAFSAIRIMKNSSPICHVTQPQNHRGLKNKGSQISLKTGRDNVQGVKN